MTVCAWLTRNRSLNVQGFEREGPFNRHQSSKRHLASKQLDLKYYAAHIKTLLDAAAIDVMRPKKSKNQDQTKVAEDGHSRAPCGPRTDV